MSKKQCQKDPVSTVLRINLRQDIFDDITDLFASERLRALL